MGSVLCSLLARFYSGIFISATKLLLFFKTRKYFYEKISKKINVIYAIPKYMLNNIFLVVLCVGCLSLKVKSQGRRGVSYYLFCSCAESYVNAICVARGRQINNNMYNIIQQLLRAPTCACSKDFVFNDNGDNIARQSTPCRARGIK